MYRFTLTYNSVDTVVCEPRGWKEFKSRIKRDFKSHGAIFKFTDGVIKLGFADGRDLLEGAFQLEGFDAVVTLTVEQRADPHSAYSVIYVGNAVMKNRDLTDNFFEVDFEGSTLQQKVVNRLKNKVKLDATTDLDGNTLTGSLTSQTDTWETIRLNNIYDADLADTTSTAYVIRRDAIVGFGDATVVAGRDLTFHLGYGQSKVQSLEKVNLDTLLLEGFPETSSDYNSIQPLWVAQKSGDANVTGTLIFDMVLNSLFFTTSTVTMSYRLALQVFRGATKQNDITLDSDYELNVGVSGGTISTFSNVTATWDEDLTIIGGDMIYLVFETATALSVSQALSFEAEVTLYANN